MNDGLTGAERILRGTVSSVVDPAIFRRRSSGIAERTQVANCSTTNCPENPGIRWSRARIEQLPGRGPVSLPRSGYRS
jgi:hypothetical protein